MVTLVTKLSACKLHIALRVNTGVHIPGCEGGQVLILLSVWVWSRSQLTRKHGQHDFQENKSSSETFDSCSSEEFLHRNLLLADCVMH